MHQITIGAVLAVACSLAAAVPPGPQCLWHTGDVQLTGPLDEETVTAIKVRGKKVIGLWVNSNISTTVIFMVYAIMQPLMYACIGTRKAPGVNLPAPPHTGILQFCVSQMNY